MVSGRLLTMNQKNLNYEIETRIRNGKEYVDLSMNQKNLNYEIETLQKVIENFG